MPFPSHACRTCRQRHVKCDETYPTCNRCTKAGKICLGFDVRPDHFAFRDENSYARGRQRKPRVSNSKQPSGFLDLDTEIKSSVFARRCKSSLEGSMRRSENLIHRSPDPNVELYALTDYVRRYIDVKRSVPDSHWSFLKPYRDEWESTDSSSTLGLATAAVSLATFGRIRSSKTALELSVKKYNNAVKKVYVALQDYDEVANDRTLLTVMLLDSYESMTANFDNSPPLQQQCLHQVGAETLLRIRRSRYPSNSRSLSLDKNIRRRLIRACVIRATPLPEWLQDGSEYGECDVELALDACLVRTPQLRSDVRSFLMSRPGSSEPRRDSDIAVAESIINQAIDIEGSLVAWAESLPSDWHYTVTRTHANLSPTTDRTQSDAVYGNTLNIYPSLEKARTWNLYRAARLMTNTIIAGLPDFQALYYTGPMYSIQQQIADMNIKNLTNEICASVPYHFERKTAVTDEMEMTGRVTTRQIRLADAADITAREAVILIFPLCSAVVISRIPEAQRAWLRVQILKMSRIIGSYTLEKIAKHY